MLKVLASYIVLFMLTITKGGFVCNCSLFNFKEEKNVFLIRFQETKTQRNNNNNKASAALIFLDAIRVFFLLYVPVMLLQAEFTGGFVVNKMCFSES